MPKNQMKTQQIWVEWEVFKTDTYNMKKIKLFEEYFNRKIETVSEESSKVTPDSDVVVNDYMLDDAETEIEAKEIIGAIVSSGSEDDFLDYFYKKYGNGTFTENDISELIAYYQEYREEVNAEKTEAEEEKDDEAGDKKDPLADLDI